jgi:5-hydroxyisourate hydrolase
MGKLTTHVLDTARGRAGAGVRVEIYRVEGQSRIALGETKTNADGRTDAPMLEGSRFTAGEYELVFHVGAFFDNNAFYERIPVRVRIVDAAQHYHVPLLCSPWGYTTYRGT